MKNNKKNTSHSNGDDIEFGGLIILLISVLLAFGSLACKDGCLANKKNREEENQQYYQKIKEHAKKKCHKLNLEFVEYKLTIRGTLVGIAGSNITCKNPKSNTYYFYSFPNDKWQKMDMN